MHDLNNINNANNAASANSNLSDSYANYRQQLNNGRFADNELDDCTILSSYSAFDDDFLESNVFGKLSDNYDSELSDSSDVTEKSDDSSGGMSESSSGTSSEGSSESIYASRATVYPHAAAISLFGKDYSYVSPELFPSNVIVGSSAIDGVGLSTTLAMLSLHLSSCGYSVAFVDADIPHGGLDVLLGLESDEGRRLQELEAPLGKLDGHVLKDELIYWNGVGVLAYAPWRAIGRIIPKNDSDIKSEDVKNISDSLFLKPWLLDAAIRGLAQCHDFVIVDVGAGMNAFNVFNTIPGLAYCFSVYASELSVLGMARMRAYNYQLSVVKELLIERLSSCSSKEAREEIFKDIIKIGRESVVVGIMPHGLSAKLCVVDCDEASQYLSRNVMGPIKYNSRMHEDIIEGYGIRKIPTSLRQVIELLANCVSEFCLSDDE